MAKTIKILEYSACGNTESLKKLCFRGDRDLKDIVLMRNMLKNQSYDIVSVRDIPYHALKKLESEMALLGFKAYIDPIWKATKQKWRYTSLSELFVKKSLGFSQIAGQFGFDTVLRYVCGSFTINGKRVYYRTSHIPCVDDSRSHISDQIARKENMLNAEIEFQKEHQNDCIICSGDYNGSADDEDCYCVNLYKEFVLSDMLSKPTYEDKKLDHVFVSKSAFEKEGIKLEAEILDEGYMIYSDHKMVSITLRDENS